MDVGDSLWQVLLIHDRACSMATACIGALTIVRSQPTVIADESNKALTSAISAEPIATA